MDELQEIQTKRLYFEYDEPLLDIREHVLKKFFYASLLLLVIAVVAGFFISFPRVISTDIVVKSGKPDIIYTFDEPVYIIEKFATASQYIKKDYPLVKISSPSIIELIRQYRELQNQADLARTKQKSLLPLNNNIVKTENEKLYNESDNLNNQKQNINNQWVNQSANLQNAVSIARSNFNRNQFLYDNGIISKADLENFGKILLEAESNYNREKLNYEQSIALIQNQLNKNRFQIQQNNQTIQKVNFEEEISVEQADRALENLKNQIQGKFGHYTINETDIVLLAPTDGYINYFFDGDKELTPNDILLKIKNNQSRYVISGYANTVNISKIKVNSPTVVKIDAYPFSEYEVLRGSVLNITNAPDKDGRYPFEIGVEEPKNDKMKLIQGMSGLATIHLEEKTFWGHVFYSIKSKFYEQMNE